MSKRSTCQNSALSMNTIASSRSSAVAEGLQLLLSGLLILCISNSVFAQAELSVSEREQLQQLTNSLQKAGQLFTKGEYVECVAEIEQSQARLLSLLRLENRPLSPKLLAAAKPIYDRLHKAHSLLELHGAELPLLPDWSTFATRGADTPPPTEPPAMENDVSLTTSSSKAERPDNSSQPTIDSTAPISFSRQIAPILVENCNGCHLDSRRASGNLRMDSYAQLMAGGDSGELIAGRNASASLLIQRVNGEVEPRMPAGGRTPLTEEQISLLSTWIREGAKYDGPDPSSDLRTAIQQEWAATASHDELFARRREQSLERWKRVLPDTTPSTAQNNEVVILGNVPEEELEQFLTQVEKAVTQSKNLLGRPLREPLVKGGLSIFVLQSRYDYGEFGRMNENRDLPAAWWGHWQANPINVYAVVVSDPERSEKASQALALELVTGAYLGSFREVPYWFAEGVARNAVSNSFRRSDPRVKLWQAQLIPALSGLKSAKELLDNRLDEESAGLVGMALTSAMLNKANRKRFEKLHGLLREGKTFSEAITFSFAPPEMLVKNWLGKK